MAVKTLMTRDLVLSILQIIGLACFVVGVLLWSVPFGLIVVGVLLVAWTLAIEVWGKRR
jgi:hypothetical protein